MHDLAPRTPLQAAVPILDHYSGVEVRERTDLALASLTTRRGKDVEARSRAMGFLGLDLPRPGGHVQSETYSATWMAPEQWFISAPLSDDALLADELKSAVGDSASVTEQTDGWCCFALSGPNCLALFEKLTPIDIAGLAAGQAVRSRFEHMAGLLICEEKGSRYLVFGQRSMAGSLLHALHITAASL